VVSARRGRRRATRRAETAGAPAVALESRACGGVVLESPVYVGQRRERDPVDGALHERVTLGHGLTTSGPNMT
jgi:hypothetical protein